MVKFIDLSHTIKDGMITYTGLPGPKIKEHLSREDSKAALRRRDYFSDWKNRNGRQYRHLY